VALQTHDDPLIEDGFLAKGSRVAVRRVVHSDMDEYIRLATASTDLHGPWIYSPHSEEEFEAYLERFDGLNALCFLVCTVSPESIAGSVTVSGIIRVPYQRGILGYGAFAGSAGQGYMTEGLRLVINYCFSELKLHRLEADIQPENERSIALAARVGMRQEGFSPKFIFIRGGWRDHERWAILSESQKA
jgi:[ribosomal protein S5]-alanine N-acetyltransferase